jgi:hypothetical protein
VARTVCGRRVRDLSLALAVLLALPAGGACDGKSIHLGDGWLDGGACLHGQVKATEVLWIGDSWILVTGSQHTRVAELARAAGAIGPNDDYVIGAVAASPLAAIANQYAAREAGATKVKVVIMDGGTWDTILANGSDASVNSVVSTFGQFLTQIARDGTVEHIVYMLLPELPGISGVAALRPLLQQACVGSEVPCHFLDLQPLWTRTDYSTAGAIPVPTEAGAVVIADAIWAAMQRNCIAQ